jgi:hypothetical protein
MQPTAGRSDAQLHDFNAFIASRARRRQRWLILFSLCEKFAPLWKKDHIDPPIWQV